MGKDPMKDAQAQGAEAASGKQEAAKEKKGKARPAYRAGELAANAKGLFGTRPECVEAALRAAGKQECTVAEADAAVKAFLRKEVR